MSRTPRHVARWRRRPLLWFAVLVPCWLLFVWDDRQTEQSEPRFAERPAIVADVLRISQFWDEVTVRYTDPETRIDTTTTITVYDMSLFPDADATTVRIEVAPGAYRDVRLAGDVYEASWFFDLLALVSLTLVWWALRQWHIVGTRRLVRADAPAYRMLGRVVHRGRLRPPVLGLWAIDAAPDAPPVCSVRLVRHDPEPAYGELECDVKGSPRPFGTLVARVADGPVMWPAGRALGWNPRALLERGPATPVRRAPRPGRPIALAAVLPGPDERLAPLLHSLAVAAGVTGFLLLGVQDLGWFGIALCACAAPSWWFGVHAERASTLRRASLGRQRSGDVLRVGGLAVEGDRLWYGYRTLLRSRRLRFEPDAVVIVRRGADIRCQWDEHGAAVPWGAGWDGAIVAPYWSLLNRTSTPEILAVRLAEPVRVGLWSRRTILIPRPVEGRASATCATRLIDRFVARPDLRALLDDPDALTLLVCSIAAGRRLQPAQAEDVRNPWPHAFCAIAPPPGPGVTGWRPWQRAASMVRHAHDDTDGPGDLPS